MLGDLHEEFERLAHTAPLRAGWRYARRAVSIGIRYLPRRLETPTGQPNERSGDPPVTSLASDVRLALRLLRRAPIFTAVVLTTLALGIGANAVVFGIVRTTLLAPLPYPDPDRVVAIWSTNTARGESHNGVSRQDADDWIAQSTSFDAIGTYVQQAANVRLTGDPERLPIAFATPT